MNEKFPVTDMERNLHLASRRVVFSQKNKDAKTMPDEKKRGKYREKEQKHCMFT